MNSNPIIVPVRNNISLTKKAVKSIFAQDIPVDLLLIDNASSDGTSHWAKTVTDMGYVHFDPPRSVAASWNYGLKFWFDHGAEYVAVLNNDIELRTDCIRLLMEEKAPFVTAVGTRDPDKIKPPYTVPDPAHKRPHPDYSAYLIRRDTWERTGGFDEKFLVAFYEDNDMHLRMHKMGIDAYCIDLPFLHHGSMTIKNSNPAERRRIQLQAAKNKEYFKRKHGVYSGTPEYYGLFGHSSPHDPNEATL